MTLGRGIVLRVHNRQTLALVNQMTTLEMRMNLTLNLKLKLTRPRAHYFAPANLVNSIVSIGSMFSLAWPVLLKENNKYLQFVQQNIVKQAYTVFISLVPFLLSLLLYETKQPFSLISS